MTSEEADDLLSNNDWSTWGDARHLLKLAYSIGYRDGAGSLNQTQMHRPHEVEQQPDELLEALKEAEPMLEAMLNHITRYLPEYRNMPALAKVRAAIKKAEEKA
jgi:hypothetical protein